MTVWALQLNLSKEEEERITERTHLPLPFDGMPDLSQVASSTQCRKLFMALYPGEPPCRPYVESL